MAYVPPHVPKFGTGESQIDYSNMGSVTRHVRESGTNESQTDHINGEDHDVKQPKSDLPQKHHVFTANEIVNYLWPRSKEESEDTKTETRHHGTTLHDSAEQPDRLSCVLLFRGANPQWSSEQVIYTKSRLEILPRPAEDNKPEHPDPTMPQNRPNSNAELSKHSKEERVNPTMPQNRPNNYSELTKDSKVVSTPETITNGESNTSDKSSQPLIDGSPDHVAVFYERFGKNSTGNERCFVFNGWHKIDKVTFLKPQSQELVSMLEKKWRSHKEGDVQTVKREDTRWKTSLSMEWAEVKLAKDEEAQEARGLPQIEKLPAVRAQRRDNGRIQGRGSGRGNSRGNGRGSGRDNGRGNRDFFGRESWGNRRFPEQGRGSDQKIDGETMPTPSLEQEEKLRAWNTAAESLPKQYSTGAAAAENYKHTPSAPQDITINETFKKASANQTLGAPRRYAQPEHTVERPSDLRSKDQGSDVIRADRTTEKDGGAEKDGGVKITVAEAVAP